ncbi:MAG: hypothetical protein HY735_38760 [Verrucomicrobia bacterium]|nr:hypothetical protein [Verrucomicrobiota bacterium]
MDRVLTRTYPTNRQETFVYTARGLTNYTDLLGKLTKFEFDALGRRTKITDAKTNVISFQYDAAGNLTSLVDAKTNQTRWVYDLFGRLKEKVDAANNTVLRFQYDAMGRLTNRWSAAKSHIGFGYDAAGNLTQINYTNTVANPDVSFQYDEMNRMTYVVDLYSAVFNSTNPAAYPTVFSYTSFGALRTENGPMASDTVTFDYFTNHWRAAVSVLQQSGTNWVQQYTYDAARRLKTVTSPAGAFTYDYFAGVSGGPVSASPLIEKLTLPSGAYVNMAYDGAARLLSTILKNSSQTSLNQHSYAMDTGDRRTKQTRLDNSYVEYTYDDIGQLLTATGKESGGVTNRLNERLTYGYDAAGNLEKRSQNALTNTFGANSRNHLTSITRSGTLTVFGNTTVAASSVTVNANEATKYGDFTYAKDMGAPADGTNTFTVIAQDSSGRKDTNVVTANLPSTVNFQYDLNGNLTSDGLRSFEYDAEDRLVKITVTNSWKTQFVYDGLGRRRVWDEYVWFNGAWAWYRNVHYVYDGNLVAHERWAGGEPPVNYTRGQDLSGSFEGAGGIGDLLARSQNVSATSDHNYYHADGSGNVTAMVNSAQKLVAKYLYDPYGRVLASSGPLAEANLYRYSSKEAHELSGLVDFGRRFYDPSLQRWLNHDPLGEAGGINLYGFVGNDPVNRVDPLGLDYYEVAPLWGGGSNVPYYYGDTFIEDLSAIPYNTGAALINTVEGVGAFIGFAGEKMFGDRHTVDAAMLYFAARIPRGVSCPPGRVGEIANAVTGRAREMRVIAKLEGRFGQAAVQREQYLRTAEGKIAIDPKTGEARRVDVAIVQDAQGRFLVEVTSKTADKAAQIAKEVRIRARGGTFIRDRVSGQLIDVSQIPTRLIRVE